MIDGSATRLERAPLALKPILRQLLTEYLLELAPMAGATLQKGSDGQVYYRWFDQYWSDPGRVPFAIWWGADLAGFCLLRDTGLCWHVAEFYVAPPYRRRGAGAAAVTALKEFCRASGRHRCLEACTLHRNLVSLAFWRSQGFTTIGEDDDHLTNVFYL